jgi:hypothetical protein
LGQIERGEDLFLHAAGRADAVPFDDQHPFAEQRRSELQSAEAVHVSARNLCGSV